MNVFRYIPLMGVLLLVYNVLSQRAGGGDGFPWDSEWRILQLPTGAEVSFTYSEGFLALALVVLLIEIVKSTSASNFAIVEQILSMLVFVVFLTQFLNSEHAAEPTFLLLTIISFVEVLAGFVIMTKVAKRDISFGGG